MPKVIDIIDNEQGFTPAICFVDQGDTSDDSKERETRETTPPTCSRCEATLDENYQCTNEACLLHPGDTKWRPRTPPNPPKKPKNK